MELWYDSWLMYGTVLTTDWYMELCSDPLLLTDVVVVDNILEFLDDDTLLTGRLVCQRWKTEITKRKGLWRRRYERLATHDPDKTFPRDTSFFPVYLDTRRVLCQMACGRGWQVDDTCDGSQCAFHRELAPYSQWDVWVSALFPDTLHVRSWQKKVVLCTEDGELVVLDEERKEVAWKTEKHTIAYFTIFRDSIFTITQLGNIERYSLDGKCEVTKTDGKLRGAIAGRAHPTAPFLLVWLADNKVCLVDDKMQVFPLRLPSPPLPQQQDDQESAELIVDLEFDMVNDGQLAVVVERKSVMCFITFTSRGEILHHMFLKCNRITEWSPLAPGQGRYRFVCQDEGHVVARAMHFSSKGIAVKQLWKKALPAAFLRQTVLSGNRFLLCCEGTNLQVYRMNDGALAADFTVFPLGFVAKCWLDVERWPSFVTKCRFDVERWPSFVTKCGLDVEHWPSFVAKCGLDVEHWPSFVTKCRFDVERWPSFVTKCGLDVEHWPSFVAKCGLDVEHWPSFVTKCRFDVERWPSFVTKCWLAGPD
ncbi:hypothetical protein ACOMHN_028486 [Nucella lapillus]